MVRNVDVELLTKNIKEMCIQANHYLAPDMEKAMREACEKESKPLAKQILGQLLENLDIAGKDIVNPLSIILSGVMMLEYIGWTEAGERIRTAVKKAIASSKVTADFYALLEKEGRNGECLSTTDFTDYLVSLL